VKICKEKSTTNVYAMKKLKKSEMLRRGQVEHVKAERNLLAEVDINCIVKLYCSFQDTKYLYLVMEYLPGGDMMTLWSLGAIMFEMLVGYPPFYSDDPMSTCRKDVRGDPEQRHKTFLRSFIDHAFLLQRYLDSATEEAMEEFRRFEEEM
ncbi:serine/threonine-protein kinase tricorner-like protein, partial [Tanacetum coccineum]